MAAETGFMIDGKLYEMPSLDSLSMDEAQVLYDYSGLVVEDFLPSEGAEPNEKGGFDLDDEQKAKMKNPGFMRALLHVAYQRGNPRISAAKVKTLVGTVNVLDLLEQLVVSSQPEGDDALPPESTTEPEPSSPRSSVESNATSGDDSRNSSDGQVVPLTPTGTIGSATSSAPSPASSAV